MAEENTGGQPEEEQEPIRFTDKRRVDPETGRPRAAGSTSEGQADAEDRAAAQADPVADPLEEAERILNDVPEGAEADADDLEAGEQVVDPSAREAELQEDLQRLQAEYVNYRRRVERDRKVEKDRTKGELISELMPVLDDLAAARQAGDLEEGPFAHIANRLETVLKQQGLSPVGEVGEAFDPNEHEAIMQQPSEEVAADHIAIVVRSGYRYGDRLLRAAQVIVSTGE